jgi:uracil-DNA glycosylase
MPIALRQALEEMLDGWKDDLSPAWKAALAGVEPDFAAVDADLEHESWEPIFPARKGKVIPGAPRKAHIFRALDGTGPADVRAVVIGQDPYPNVSWATGRAFEQGDLEEWLPNPALVSDSLERIIPAVAVARTGNREYTDLVNASRAWVRVVADLASGALTLPSPPRLFDHWQQQGVLFLNAGLTLSRFERGGSAHQLRGHIPLWRPVVRAILEIIAARTSGHVVFLLWGSVARTFFQESGIEQAAKDAGTWQTRVRTVQQAHPAASNHDGPLFFREPNTFLDANRALREMGAEAVEW